MLCLVTGSRNSVSGSSVCPLQPAPMQHFFCWGWCPVKGRGSPEGLKFAPPCPLSEKQTTALGDFMSLSAYLDVPRANLTSSGATLPGLLEEELKV